MPIPTAQNLKNYFLTLASALLLVAAATASSAQTTPPAQKPDVVTAASLVALPNRPIRLAAIVLPEMPSTLKAVHETAALLRTAFKPHPIEFETLTSAELTERIKAGSVDAFLASSGYYWRMRRYGVMAVGTLISPQQPDPNNATALTFLVRAGDSRFNELYDLKDHVIGSTFKTAFMTYRIGLAEIAKLGEDPEDFFKKIVFTEKTNNDEVAALLDDKKVDAVMIKACWLEEQSADIQARYRVLNPRFGGVQCKHSTDTYPGIMLAVTQGASPNIAHIIARTLLSCPQLSGDHRWGVATDLRAVDNVYRLLKIENYAYLREMTPTRWLIAHWQIPATVVLFLLGLALHAWRTSVLVKKRTRELTASVQAQQKAQTEIQTLSEQMESLHKVTVVGQLSSMIAHELAQPLSVIQYYCESQKDILNTKPLNSRLLEISRLGIESALSRTRNIVDKVRSYNHGNTSRCDAVDVSATIKRVTATLNADLLKKTELTVTCKPNLFVRADRLEFELMISNLLKNALEASHEDSYPLVTLEALRCNKESVLIRIENSGRLLTNEDIRRIQTPLLTSKATGLGLGVTIACALAEASGGQTQFKVRPEGGLVVVLTLRSAEPRKN